MGGALPRVAAGPHHAAVAVVLHHDVVPAELVDGLVPAHRAVQVVHRQVVVVAEAAGGDVHHHHRRAGGLELGVSLDDEVGHRERVGVGLEAQARGSRLRPRAHRGRLAGVGGVRGEAEEVERVVRAGLRLPVEPVVFLAVAAAEQADLGRDARAGLEGPAQGGGGLRDREVLEVDGLRGAGVGVVARVGRGGVGGRTGVRGRGIVGIRAVQVHGGGVAGEQEGEHAVSGSPLHALGSPGGSVLSGHHAVQLPVLEGHAPDDVGAVDLEHPGGAALAAEADQRAVVAEGGEVEWNDEEAP